MGSIVGDYFVPLFFVAGTLAMWFLAYRFWSAKGAVFKNFGIGLALYGLAFAVWSLAVFFKTNIEALTSLGVVPFAIAHLFFLTASTEKVKASKRTFLLFLGIAYLVVLFLLRTIVYPSDPGFSDDGLFYFNAQPPVIMLYVIAFAGSLLPAINVASREIKDKLLRNVSQFGFTVLSIGGIILVTSVDDNLQTINGWVMGLTYVTLLAVYATKKVK